jgi:hypothetical protein
MVAMTHARISNLRRVRLLPAVLVFCLGLPPCLFGDDPKKPRHDQDVMKLCRELEAQYKNKKDRDTERIMVIYQIFDEIYSKADAREQKTIVKTIRKAYDIQPFPEDSSFLVTGAACLSEMGKPGLDALVYALNHKNLKSRPSTDQIAAMGRVRVKEIIIQAIGFNKDPGALKTLYKQLKSDHPSFLKAACTALSCFSDLPLPQRKPIVENLIKVYLRLDAEAEAGGEESRPYETLISVEVAFNMSLRKLTFRNFESAREWKTWYEEYKDKKKW